MLSIEEINNFDVMLLFQNYPSKENYQLILQKAFKIQPKVLLIEAKKKNYSKELLKRVNFVYSLIRIIKALFVYYKK